MNQKILHIILVLLCTSFCHVHAQETKRSQTGAINISKRTTGEAGKNKQRRGPSNITFDLNAAMQADLDFTGVKLLSIYNTVYRDANIESGYYYFLPSEYNLSWDEHTGKYDFNINYGTAEAGTRARTTITAILKPALSRKDLRLSKEILKQNIKNKEEASYGITDLAPMPMAQSPKVDFTNLSQFGVSEKDISIRVPSDLNDPIFVSFTTDRVDELMGMFFNDIGLFGDVIIFPDGEGMPSDIRIPFNLKIDSPKTYGKFELFPNRWRKNTWKNPTDYPVILTHLHILRKEGNNTLNIYSWDLGKTEIPEKAQVNFENANSIPSFLDRDRKVERMWMEYSVKPCRSCNIEVQNKIVGGVDRPRVANLEFTVLTPLEFADATLMKIKIRSIQADPNGLTKVNLPTLTIKQDGTTANGGRLFVPKGKDPEFEYYLMLYKEDGTVYKSDNWQKTNEPEVVIGTKQIKNQISALQ